MKNSIIIAALLICSTTFITPACSQAKYANMNVTEFKELIKDTSIVILDVRTAEEFNQGHIDNAINIDFYSKTFTEDVIKAIDKNKKIALYCRSGRRSATAAEKLSPLGYNVVNLLGGYLDWASQEK